MKYFGLAAAALMMTISASAGTINGTCSVSPANTNTGATNNGPGTITCSQFTAASLSGDTSFSIAITAFDSFSQGPASSITYTFTYAGLQADMDFLMAAPPNTCVSAGGGASNSCTDAVTGTISANSGVYQLGNSIAGTDADFAGVYEGAGTWTVGTVSGAQTAGVAVTTGFSAGASIFETLTYSTAAPEPGSMMLLGGGLLAAGLIGRKKLAGRK
jgi:hypothetical protein